MNSVEAIAANWVVLASKTSTTVRILVIPKAEDFLLDLPPSTDCAGYVFGHSRETRSHFCTHFDKASRADIPEGLSLLWFVWTPNR